ncbi:Gfo/Idh/MocA family oxidoreductase [candidate division KSB1 bacterium]|nr:Gfo/Idh/MocA family oxidoreductase [candidate division KSB1 bacterium]
MVLKLAFEGFRHGHIFDLYKRADAAPEIEIVAACEEDPATRNAIMAAGTANITHDNYENMLKTVECDAVAVGDYYAKRGAIIYQALSRGKHVICDKPLCTSLEELNQIEHLCAEKHLKIGCMLDLRDTPQFIGVRKLVREGKIGDVHAISFGGQHPLLLGTRPDWYFEPGKHGGTINDIAIHAIDIIPWISGLEFTIINSARSWNAFATDFPHFKDAGQMMLTMNNGCGVLGDVSYFMPDSSGYSLPLYWRMTFWGRKGVLETSCVAGEILVAVDGEQQLSMLPLPEGNPGGYLEAFMRDVSGDIRGDALDTASVLRAARHTLMIQRAADLDLREVDLT